MRGLGRGVGCSGRAAGAAVGPAAGQDAAAAASCAVYCQVCSNMGARWGLLSTRGMGAADTIPAPPACSLQGTDLARPIQERRRPAVLQQRHRLSRRGSSRNSAARSMLGRSAAAPRRRRLDVHRQITACSLAQHRGPTAVAQHAGARVGPLPSAVPGAGGLLVGWALYAVCVKHAQRRCCCLLPFSNQPCDPIHALHRSHFMRRGFVVGQSWRSTTLQLHQLHQLPQLQPVMIICQPCR
jgi:hypothetical protein